MSGDHVDQFKSPDFELILKFKNSISEHLLITKRIWGVGGVNIMLQYIPLSCWNQMLSSCSGFKNLSIMVLLRYLWMFIMNISHCECLPFIREKKRYFGGGECHRLRNSDLLWVFWPRMYYVPIWGFGPWSLTDSRSWTTWIM